MFIRCTVLATYFSLENYKYELVKPAKHVSSEIMLNVAAIEWVRPYPLGKETKSVISMQNGHILSVECSFEDLTALLSEGDCVDNPDALFD